MTKNDLGRFISSTLPAPCYNKTHIPQEYKNYLRLDNPRLLYLKEKYRAYENKRGGNSQWQDSFCELQIELSYFRGDNAYIWQVRDNNTAEKYNLTTDYLRSIDRLDFFSKTQEDNSFGIISHTTPSGTVVSRDLLDSISELLFLENILGISKLKNIRILDIGAGYGRLAHRTIECLNNIENFYCTDAIAQSTFLSEFYLTFRKIVDKCSVITAYDIKSIITDIKPNLAINIHSFSECTLASIEHWLNILSAAKVTYLMIAPNNHKNDGGKNLISLEQNFTHISFENSLNKFGYKLAVKMPKYLNSTIQQEGISPTYYHLYELK